MQACLLQVHCQMLEDYLLLPNESAFEFKIAPNQAFFFATEDRDSRTNTPGQIPTGQIPTGQIPTGQLPPLPNTHRTNTPWTYTHHKMKCEEKP